MRDNAANMERHRKDLEKNQTNRNDAAKKARMGHFQLDQTCKDVPPEFQSESFEI